MLCECFALPILPVWTSHDRLTLLTDSFGLGIAPSLVATVVYVRSRGAHRFARQPMPG
jgi:hypothetical protein